MSYVGAGTHIRGDCSGITHNKLIPIQNPITYQAHKIKKKTQDQYEVSNPRPLNRLLNANRLQPEPIF